jgi:hypothetical protein
MKKDETILLQQPFRNIIGKIIKTESLEGPGAISGDTFKLTSSSGKLYKIRYCKTQKIARTIEKNVKSFSHAFPRFYGREGRYLLFGWFNGRNLTKEPSLNECYQIGKLLGEAHALNDIDKNKKADDFFNNRLELVKKNKVFDEKIYARIVLMYKRLKEKLKIDIVLEFHDVHPRNLMIDKNETVLYVDEEGFTHKVKGLGLAKPLFINEIIKSSEQKESFWKGYHEHHNSDYFDKDYQVMVLFLQLIRSIGTKSSSKNLTDRRKEVFEKHKKMLMGLI